MNHEETGGAFSPDEEMEARLWAYIDGLAEENERTLIGRLIAEQAEWKAKYEELFSLNQSLQSMELDEPSMRFTKDVMEGIARTQIVPAARNYINSRVIWGIALFFISSCVGFLVYGLSQVSWTSAPGSKSSIENGLDKMDFSKVFGSSSMNILMMVNVVLALFLVDRYLSGKKKKLAKHQL